MGSSLKEAEDKINSATKPASFALPEAMRASVSVGIENTRATVNNVLAYLPGKTDEYIILGAHYDHLGRGNFDSLAPSQIGQIHPGADDNASGTAGLLELARLLSPLKGQLTAWDFVCLICRRRAGASGVCSVGERADKATRQSCRHVEHGHDRSNTRAARFTSGESARDPHSRRSCRKPKQVRR